MKYQRLFIILIMCFPMLGNAQIKLRLKKMSFTDALSWLHEEHNLQYSFEADSYSECILNISAHFQDLESALMAILEPCQLDYQKIGSVYLIGRRAERASCYFKGRLLDAESGKALSGVVIEHTQGKTLSDEDGYFSIVLPESNSQILFSHVVYQALDTALVANAMHTVKLHPQNYYLEEVLIEDQVANSRDDYDVPIIQALQNKQLSTGFFLNFEELRRNEPSKPYEVLPDQRRSQEINRFALSEFYRFKYTRAGFKAIDSIYAFSDGQTLFISILPDRFNRNSRFVKARLVGPYAFIRYQGPTSFSGLECDPGTSETQREVIDLRTGRRSLLNKHFLRPLLAADSILGPEYESRIFKGSIGEEYFFRFYGIERKSKRNKN
ncbi:MAG: carboxypeptidase-like regulatory domain-containing protein [Bacteroidota bacterium]